MHEKVIRNVLQAFAIGDACGMPTQMLSHKRALEYFDSVGIFSDAPGDNPVCPGLQGGSITDDTYQLMILADNLIAGSGVFEADSFASEMLEWESRMVIAGSLDLLGPSTKAALTELTSTHDKSTVSLVGTTNGAAMRVPAIACYIAVNTPKGLRRLIEQIGDVNRISHHSLAANLGSVAVASAISAGIDGDNFDAATRVAMNAAGYVLKKFRGNEADNFISRLPTVFEDLETHHDLGGVLACLEYIDSSIGTSLESEQSVLAAFAIAKISFPSPLEAASNAAKLGGDSDTIAAIASALVAACGAWTKADEDAWELVSRVNWINFDSRALAFSKLRNTF